MIDDRSEFAVDNIDVIAGFLILLTLLIAMGLPEAASMRVNRENDKCISMAKDAWYAEKGAYGANGHYINRELWPYMGQGRDGAYRYENDREIENAFRQACGNDWSMGKNIVVQRGSFTITARTSRVLFWHDIVANKSGVYVNHRRLNSYK